MLYLLREHAPWFLTGSAAGEAAAIVAIERQAADVTVDQLAEGLGRLTAYPMKDAEALARAYGAVRSAKALDVERLTDALTTLPQTDWDPCAAESIGEVAAAIAREYAALGDPKVQP